MITSATPNSFEKRLEALEAMESIRLLKARYAGLADDKYTKDYKRQPEARMIELAQLQAACFTEDAVWAGGSAFGADLVGRAQLAEWFGRSPWCFAMHYYGSPEISVKGDEAAGTWRLWQMALRADTHEALLLSAVTSEQYRRQPDGNWLHSRMLFEQVHMLPIAAGAFPLRSTFAAQPDGSGADLLPRNMK
ncbi:MAG: nuclear transport factor 2 family protein [Pseudomonadota bacterium]